MRGATQIKSCKNCNAPMTVRTADVKRGWGKFCSKSCKATHQSRNRTSKTRAYPRHDGVSPMKFKKCQSCGAPAVNGVYSSFGLEGGIEWLCADHMDDTHPFDMEGVK